MKLVAIECECGHVQTDYLPNFPHPDMLNFCQVCRKLAKGVWEPEIQNVIWMQKEEAE